MARPIFSRILMGTMPALLAIVLAGVDRPAVGQEQEAETKPAAAKKVKKFRGRLPNYYGQVVDQKQREAIYNIQEEYAPKIAALRAQLAALIKECSDKIAGVLTDEQLKNVEEAKAAARAKRDRKRAPKEKPAAGPSAQE